MKHSSERIVVTHAGSLPRPREVVDCLISKERGMGTGADFDAAMRRGVADIVRRQAEIGIDVASDGETSKISYSTYIKDRYHGFGGEHVPRTHLDLREHPEFRARMKAFLGPRHERRMQCVAPVALRDRRPLEQDLANFRAALDAVRVTEGFLNAASPGVVAVFMPNACYPSHEAYIEALAEALRIEYEAIVAAGFVLQVDCPDLAMGRHTAFQDLSEDEFVSRAALHAEALNHALARVPQDRVRIHLCWGNYEGPHDYDIALERILPAVLSIRARAISFEGANPRHEHEWVVWRDARLPDDLLLIPGVLDSCTNYVEHPELVAQRIERYARIVGRERVLAGTDCGFGTFAGYGKVDGSIAFKKLRALAEGAALATARLWK
ncbi:MAG: cobalamin-independent methionine synthase II family protein [Betaproteobacteria bacterium]|nr:cobalamin-independent methionine synthase II family protein [Betaproteobacteria bacterium]